MISDKLQFFNKEGYPYNFEFDTASNVYRGKIMFDENSTDTYKSQTIHIFEKIKSFGFSSSDADYIETQFINTSGYTFTRSTFTGTTITSVEKVNSSSLFHSKWIDGDRVNELHPKGTIIKFNGTTNPELLEGYYTVLDARKNAILISTSTVNSSWTNLTNLSGVSISSLNTANIFNANTSYYVEPGRKMTVHNSTYNDGVYTVVNSASTYNTLYKVDLSAVTANQQLSVLIDLYTRRPSIYEGNMVITTGSTSNEIIITFNDYIKSKSILNTGQTLYLEDYDNNIIFTGNPEFTITEILNYTVIFNGTTSFYKEIKHNANWNLNFISSSAYIAVDYNKFNYFIEAYGNITGLTINDTIKTVANPVSATTLNENRDFKITNIINRTVKDYRITYWIDKICSDSTWLNMVFGKSVTNNITLKAQIEEDALYMYNTVDTSYHSISADTTTRFSVQQYTIPEFGNNYYIRETLPDWKINTIKCTTSASVTPISYTGFGTLYLATNTLTFNQTGLPTKIETANAFISQYGTILNSYGIDTIYESGATTEYLNFFGYYSIINTSQTWFNTRFGVNGVSAATINSQIISSSFIYSEEIPQYEIAHIYESDITAQNYRLEIAFDLGININGYGFNFNFNGADYYVPYNVDTGVTSNTQETILDFITIHYSAFTSLGYVMNTGLTSSGYSFILTSNGPDYNVVDWSIRVNQYSTYYLIDEDRRDNFQITANYIEFPSTIDLYSFGMSTGMIVDIHGSNYGDNNKAYNILGLSNQRMELSYQGPFTTDTGVTVEVNVREFIRKPRESYYSNVIYKSSWADDTEKSIFFYDFSGEQLDRVYSELNTNGLYCPNYVGQRPLININDCNPPAVYLNWTPSDQIFMNAQNEIVNDNPAFQQTVFDNMEFVLEQYDSGNDYNFIPEPISLNLGLNSIQEGVTTNTLYLDKVETLILSGYTSSTIYLEFSENGTMQFTTPDTFFNLLNYGFNTDQLISFQLIDQANTGQSIFTNTDIYEVLNVSRYSITVNTAMTSATTFNTFTTSGKTYLYKIIVEPRRILELVVYGQTVDMDERFEIYLKNIGVDIPPDLVYIFKETDINEGGIDWIKLNEKRKEMLLVFPDIWNYVGSYKAFIGAINYFGYGDLQLYEYYKNINPASPLYNKLHRVMLKDIFDNQVDGWFSEDYIKTYSNRENWRKTNLFNLTYRITDDDGNFVQMYSLDDVQYKLMGLKKWLKKNILPLSTNIIDITGVADVKSNVYLVNDSSFLVNKSVLKRNTTAINTYSTVTRGFDSTWHVTFNFYHINEATVVDDWWCKVRSFSRSGDTLTPQQYFKLYKTDLEPFSFTINSDIDPYIMIETCHYNDNGMGVVYDVLENVSTSRRYMMIQQAMRYNGFEYLDWNGGVYIFDEHGYIILND